MAGRLAWVGKIPSTRVLWKWPTSGSGGPGVGGGSTEGPGTELPGTEGPGTEGPGTEGPGTEGPGTQGPGTEPLAPSEPVQLGASGSRVVLGHAHGFAG